TLPLIRPGLFAGWLLVFVPVIQELSASILLFSSSSITLAVAVYNLYETGYIEPVAALAMVNMAIIGVAIWIAYRISAGYAGLGFAAARRNDPAPITTQQEASWPESQFADCRKALARRPKSPPLPMSTSRSRTIPL